MLLCTLVIFCTCLKGSAASVWHVISRCRFRLVEFGRSCGRQEIVHTKLLRWHFLADLGWCGSGSWARMEYARVQSHCTLFLYHSVVSELCQCHGRVDLSRLLPISTDAFNVWPLGILRAVDCEGRLWKTYVAYPCIKRIKDRVHPNPNSLILQSEISRDHCRDWLGLTKDTWRQLQAELLMQQCADSFRGGCAWLQRSKISEDLRSSYHWTRVWACLTIASIPSWDMMVIDGHGHPGLWSIIIVYHRSLTHPWYFQQLSSNGFWHRSKCWSAGSCAVARYSTDVDQFYKGRRTWDLLTAAMKGHKSVRHRSQHIQRIPT